MNANQYQVRLYIQGQTNGAGNIISQHITEENAQRNANVLNKLANTGEEYYVFHNNGGIDNYAVQALNREAQEFFA